MFVLLDLNRLVGDTFVLSLGPLRALWLKCYLTAWGMSLQAIYGNRDKGTDVLDMGKVE